MMALPLLIDDIRVIVLDSYTAYVYWTSNAYMFEIMVYDDFNESVFNTTEDHHMFDNLIPETNYTMIIKTLNQNVKLDDINIIVKWITPEKKGNLVASAINNNESSLESDTTVIIGCIIGGIIIGLIISLFVVLLKKQRQMTRKTDTIPEDVIVTNEQDSKNLTASIYNPTYVIQNGLDNRLSDYIEIDKDDRYEERLYDNVTDGQYYTIENEVQYANVNNDLIPVNQEKSGQKYAYANDLNANYMNMTYNDENSV
jgi:hypothetical protein